MHSGFKVWLLKRHGPNLCFLMAFELSTRFPQRKFDCLSPCFRNGNRHRFALGDMDSDDHSGRAGGVGIYTYNMHNASIQSRKVNAYILRAWPKIGAGK